MRLPFKVPWLLVVLWAANSLGLFLLVTRLDLPVQNPNGLCMWAGLALAGLEYALIQRLRGE